MSESDQSSTSAANFNSKKPFGSAARLYREAGWLGVLPLPAGKKNPPPKGYTGAGKEYPTEKTVEAWITSNAKGNIALRLAEVDREFWPIDLPSVYAGNAVDGWELVGIDVDDYKDKSGGNQRDSLEYMYGELPATALSSARWGSGGSSCISIFLVPKGYRFMGKAADSIEIIQKRHRYMVAWPSLNPDAPTAIVDGVAVPARYSWRWGRPKDVGADENSDGFTALETIPGTPRIAPSKAANDGESDSRGVAVLPEAWFNFLSRSGERETEDAISSLSDNELMSWVTDELRWEGDPCKRVSNALSKALEDLADSPDSHTWLNSFLWHLFNLAAEGHSGIGYAYREYIQAWQSHAFDFRGAAPEDLNAEIQRSIIGALSKIEPKYVAKPVGAEYADSNEAVEHLPLRSDICVGNEIENVDRLGPIIGPMPVNTCPPADDYDHCDRGNAQHFADLYAGNMHYYLPKQAWVFWTGLRWVEADEALTCMAFERVRYEQRARADELWAATTLFDASNAETKAEFKDSVNAAKKMEAWYLKSGYRSFVRNAVDMAKGEYRRDRDALDDDGQIDPNGVLKGILLSEEIFDQKRNLLACSNGVLDLNDVASGVRPGRKDDYLSMNTNVLYLDWRYIVNGDPVTGEHPKGSNIASQSEIWEKYLNLVLPSNEIREYVQMALGYSIVGGNPSKKVVFVEGQSNTGKTTMLQAIKNAMGDYCGTGEVSMFRGQRFKVTLATNIMKRVLVISEPNNSKDALEADVVKSLSGNDTQTIEIKYSNKSWDVVPHFTPLIACNVPPRTDNSDDAFWNRILSVPFHEQIAAEAKNEGDAEATINARIVVLSWLVEGWARYQKDPNALDNPPKSIAAAQVSFAGEMNFEGDDATEFIRRWVDHNCDTKINAPNDFEDAYNAAVEAARLKGKQEVGASHWAGEWTPTKESMWRRLRADAAKSNIRITKSGRGHGEMMLQAMGIEDSNSTRRIEVKAGEPKVPTAVFVGVRLRDNSGKLGKW